jgi:murein DD-endopeptidase MepM/ murein hydrolase activator NlpD
MRRQWATIAVVALLVALYANQIMADRLATPTLAMVAADVGGMLTDSSSELFQAMLASTNIDAPEETAEEDCAGPLPQVVEHVVAEGETLDVIAHRYGTDAASLMLANDLYEQSSLEEGQRLLVLTEPGVLHVIGRGDTLWDLSRTYQVPLEAIYAANPEINPGALKIGARVIVPDVSTAVRRQMIVSRSSTASRQGFCWPLSGRITSGYGLRWGKLHAAIDIAVSVGTTVKAAAPGTVTYAGWSGGYGYLVKIRHSGGYETRYGHNSRVLVKVGQQVDRGQAIARSGSTGYSTGPHLHFEVRKNGTPINPMTVLP